MQDELGVQVITGTLVSRIGDNGVVINGPNCEQTRVPCSGQGAYELRCLVTFRPSTLRAAYSGLGPGGVPRHFLGRRPCRGHRFRGNPYPDWTRRLFSRANMLRAYAGVEWGGDSGVQVQRPGQRGDQAVSDSMPSSLILRVSVFRPQPSRRAASCRWPSVRASAARIITRSRLGIASSSR